MNAVGNDLCIIALAIVCVALLLRLRDDHKSRRARASIQLSLARLASANGGR